MQIYLKFLLKFHATGKTTDSLFYEAFRQNFNHLNYTKTIQQYNSFDNQQITKPPSVKNSGHIHGFWTTPPHYTQSPHKHYKISRHTHENLYCHGVKQNKNSNRRALIHVKTIKNPKSNSHGSLSAPSISFNAILILPNYTIYEFILF